MKKISKKILLIILISLIILFTSICIIIASTTNNDNNFTLKKEKIYYEMKYLDSQIIYMANELNNLNETENFNMYINWNTLQRSAENLYNYWNSTILDLSSLNLNRNSLTDFGKILDNLTISIKNKEKQNTLDNLVLLYNKITLYCENLNCTENYKNIMYAKYNLLLAYSIVEKGNWTLTYENILKSDNHLYNVINSMDNSEYNQYNINQAYVAVKELENIINVKDLDVFYIKYKMAINKLQFV